MQVTFKVTRQTGPQEEPTLQSYVLDVDPEVSVFEALLKLREEQDGSLAFRGSCSRGFCGDCTLRANGGAMVACLVPVGRVVKDGTITIAPIPNTKVVKDALFDVEQFLWHKYKAVRPWLETDGGSGRPIQDQELEPVRTAMRCTMCGLCDEGCTVIDVDKEFLGPAALTKLYRIVKDPREKHLRRRFIEAGERRGLWDCVHCWEASEHCPWGINPTHKIMELRDISLALGVKSGQGNPMVARHYTAFAESVRKYGWLDERGLAMKTYGLPPHGFSLSGIISQTPIALKALRRGKASLLSHPKRPGAEQVLFIFQKVEEAHKKQAQTQEGEEKG